MLKTFPIPSFDLSLFHMINGLATTLAPLNPIAILLAQYSPIIWAMFLALLWFYPSHNLFRSRRAVVYALVAGALSLCINVLLGHLLPYRPRPFVFEPHLVHQLVSHGRDTSFPSDHSTGSFAIAMALLFAGRRVGLWATALALGVAIARVWVGVHWPTDVLAGVLIGSASAGVVLAGRHRLEPLVTRVIKWFGVPRGVRESGVR